MPRCYVLAGTEHATCTQRSSVGQGWSVIWELNEALTAKLDRDGEEVSMEQV
jgi:hypothetical protein